MQNMVRFLQLSLVTMVLIGAVPLPSVFPDLVYPPPADCAGQAPLSLSS